MNGPLIERTKMTDKKDYRQRTEEFLQIAPQFKLGTLTTETQHPDTLELSIFARQNLPRAMTILKEIDLKTLSVLKSKLEEIYDMATAVRKTLDQGGNIFLCGCGSTGHS